MRLAIVSQEFPPETALGGIGSQNYAKAQGLASLGHEVCVISHSTDSGWHERSDGPVRVLRIPDCENWLHLRSDIARWITYSTQVAAAIDAVLKDKPLDLIEFPDWGSEGFVYLLNRDNSNSVPTVIHLHGPIVMFAHAIGWPDLQSEFYRVGSMMERTCLRLADAVFSSSRCSATWCRDYHGIDGDRIPVLHTGVDCNVFRPLDVPKHPHWTIIFVGKIERNKGVVELVEAACELSGEFPDLKLQLLGRGNSGLMEQLRTRTVKAGKPDLIDAPGFVPRDELPSLLCRAHVFAAPSIYEGGPGFVYLEAMACGLPVIACEGSGASEVVTAEETGLLVPPRDVGALVEALRRLLSNPGERAEMGSRAQRYVEREADSRICIRRLEAFYEEVLRRDQLAE